MEVRKSLSLYCYATEECLFWMIVAVEKCIVILY